MPDDFADALERLDVTFADFDTMDGLINRLDSILGRRASALQIDVAVDKFAHERDLAVEFGFQIDRFVRRGQPITQLRDRFGRFVAVGAQGISEFLRAQF